MKQKLTQFSKVILLYFIIVFSSCENEEVANDNATPSISTAKSWFEEFKAKENFQPIFKDLIYNWQDASITVLTNGTEAITVPVLYPEQSSEYYGHKMMYLYPNKIGKSFDVSLFEFIPNPKKVRTRQDTIDFNAFEGYIINWDLVHGFVRGAKFEENLSVEAIRVEVIENRKKNNKTHKEAPIIKLDEVVIIRPGNNNTGSGGYTFAITGNYAPFGSGSTSGYYSNSPYVGGGRGGSNANSNSQTNPCDQLKKMIDKDTANKKNLSKEIDWLVAKVKARNNNKESGVEVQMRMNKDETYRYEFNRIDSPDKFSVGLLTGSMYIGGIHSHPSDGYAMFSFQDVRFLLNAYDAASSSRKSDVFNMVVCKDAAGVTNTYTIKVDDIENLRNNVNNVWNDEKYASYTKIDDRIKAIHRDQAKVYEKSNGELEKSFLEQFKDFGISIYKADASLSSFSKLTLNSLNVLTKIPCNLN
jgi:hypothetical protein